ncbi:MAG: hypothetical protein H6719_35205 [Sandaracinaceae bacterium]|nr:hypothetical protein [Sandaracinaceae bacterium]
MGEAARVMTDADDETRERLERAGVSLTAEEWAAFPRAARERLAEHPAATESERKRLNALVRWLLWEFPPGWSRRER